MNFIPCRSKSILVLITFWITVLLQNILFVDYSFAPNYQSILGENHSSALQKFSVLVFSLVVVVMMLEGR